ncbi:MAG: bifunctional enzyme CysN/CysC [Gammaproteobacteria bacterium]|jgi:bifunctional enzyme CysN/CysC
MKNIQSSSMISKPTSPDSRKQKSQLRFITCGSVDDGKSTLLGRLLYDSKSIFRDQLSATQVESQKYGTQGDNIDLALLVDGLQAEREQGITIDVAYRFFETDNRKFIAADTPGHEQYTRNMVTGASTADLAIILIDASRGVLKQTKRHSYLVSLLGIKKVVLAINKMDTIDYDQSLFDAIAEDYQHFAEKLEIESTHIIPVSALTGENVFADKGQLKWYEGPTLMELLESVDADEPILQLPFRLPVQWVNRPSRNFRGFSGTINGGHISTGDEMVTSLSGKCSTVKEIYGPSGKIEKAIAGQAVTLVLNDEIDISRGDLICKPDGLAEVADQLAAHIVWMHEEPLLPERSYLIRFSTASASAQVTDLVHSIDVNTLDQHAAKTLALNEVGYCKLSLDKAIAFDAYKANRSTGSFVLIDKFTNATVGAGLVDFALRRASNIEWHKMEISKTARAKANKQKPCILWFTGLSGAGKSTIADCLEQKLATLGKRTYLLDGDNVRHALNKDLGFTDQDRVENIRRVAEVSRLMMDAGLIVLTSFISPFKAERQMARELTEEGEFIEVYVDVPLAVCEQRDPKGLYKKARAGNLKNFTGIDSKYEPPDNAEIVLKCAEHSVEALADQIVSYLTEENSQF